MKWYLNLLIILIGILFLLSLVMPGYQTKKTCESLGLLQENKFNCMDNDGNTWSLGWSSEIGKIDWRWNRDYCANKCVDNLCSNENGFICQNDLLQ